MQGTSLPTLRADAPSSSAPRSAPPVPPPTAGSTHGYRRSPLSEREAFGARRSERSHISCRRPCANITATPVAPGRGRLVERRQVAPALALSGGRVVLNDEGGVVRSAGYRSRQAVRHLLPSIPFAWPQSVDPPQAGVASSSEFRQYHRAFHMRYVAVGGGEKSPRSPALMGSYGGRQPSSRPGPITISPTVAPSA
jgi:hypothetical protein